MIEQQTIDGRGVTIAYFNAGFVPADKDSAAFAKLLFDDGEMITLSTMPPEKSRKISEPDIKTQLLAWSKAIAVLDASEVLIRDLIERELSGIARTPHVKLGDAMTIARRLTKRIEIVREKAVKAAFRLVRGRVGNVPIRGHSLAVWAQSMLRDDMKGIDTAIRTGLIAGLENTEIARKVIGSMGLNGVDGVTEFTRHKIAHLGRVAVKDSIQRRKSTRAP